MVDIRVFLAWLFCIVGAVLSYNYGPEIVYGMFSWSGGVFFGIALVQFERRRG